MFCRCRRYETFISSSAPRDAAVFTCSANPDAIAVCAGSSRSGDDVCRSSGFRIFYRYCCTRRTPDGERFCLWDHEADDRTAEGICLWKSSSAPGYLETYRVAAGWSVVYYAADRDFRDDTIRAGVVRLWNRQQVCTGAPVAPAISGLVSVTMPTGAKAFTSGGYDSSVALGWSKNLPDAINLGGASGVAWVSDRGSHHDELSHSVSLSRGLAHGLTPYAEVAYDHSRTLSGDSPWMVDGGSSRNVGSNVQVDAEYGRGLASQQSQAWFVSAGCSFRAAGRVRH